LHICFYHLSLLTHRWQTECGQPAMLVYGGARHHLIVQHQSMQRLDVMMIAKLETMLFVNDALMMSQHS